MVYSYEGKLVCAWGWNHVGRHACKHFSHEHACTCEHGRLFTRKDENIFGFTACLHLAPQCATPPLPRDLIPNVDSPERSHPSVQYSTAWLPGRALWDALNFIWSYVATFKGAIYQINKCSGEQDFPMHIPPKLKICSNLKKRRLLLGSDDAGEA